MPITNEPLLRYCNETVRPVADLLAGILDTPTRYLDALVGQGHAVTLGTDDATLLREAAWGVEEYTAVGAPEVITDSGSGGRVTLTNYDVIAFTRVMVVLKQMLQANPALGPLVRKIAVNPRV